MLKNIYYCNWYAKQVALKKKWKNHKITKNEKKQIIKILNKNEIKFINSKNQKLEYTPQKRGAIIASINRKIYRYLEANNIQLAPHINKT